MEFMINENLTCPVGRVPDPDDDHRQAIAIVEGQLVAPLQELRWQSLFSLLPVTIDALQEIISSYRRVSKRLQFGRSRRCPSKKKAHLQLCQHPRTL